MKIAVIGGGNGGYAAAADFSEAGHEVRFWRRDAAAFGPVRDRGKLTILDEKGEREVAIAMVADDLSEAVDGAELLVLPVPAFAQESLALALAPLYEDGQVVFLPPGTFGTYLLARAKARAGNDARVCFAETGTLPHLARKRDAATIAIAGRATRLPTGVLPAKSRDAAYDVLNRAYESIEPLDDALSGALMNAGPIIHPPLILMNAGPLEHFEAWDIHNEGTQPSIRAVTDALDEERIAVREALSYGAPHFPLRDHYDKEGAEWMYGRGAHGPLVDSEDWREPIDLHNHRYMTEDVALGLAFLVSVADWAGVPVPIARGMLAMGSAIVGEDYRVSGRTLETLGLHEYSSDELRALLRDGPDA